MKERFSYSLFMLSCTILCLMTACSQPHSNAIAAEGETPVKVADSFSFTEGPAVDAKGDVYFTDQPNGIVGTPDGKQLYVAEAKANRILKYDIHPDGNLTNRQVFADMGSDGMTIDERGNIYLTGDGVTVFDKNGQKIAHFPIPEDWTANVCFGGKERNILFKCVLAEDDSQRVLKMMQQADAIIMGAPCYWGNIPGQMKLMFDRQVYGMMRDTTRFPEPLMKGKKCILISTCTTPWPWNILFKQSRGAIRAMREIARYAGFKIVSTIERGGTAMHPELTDKDKQRCRKAIERFS